MDREILFRGYTGRNWQYGYLIDKEAIRNFDQNGLPISTYRVIKETIGQYTGLKDKNGTKIFEGDIVYDSYREYSYLVKYWLGQGMYFLDKINDRDGNWYSFEDVDFSENIEVIGNIHDNHELLEK